MYLFNSKRLEGSRAAWSVAAVVIGGALVLAGCSGSGSDAESAAGAVTIVEQEISEQVEDTSGADNTEPEESELVEDAEEPLDDDEQEGTTESEDGGEQDDAEISAGGEDRTVPAGQEGSTEQIDESPEEEEEEEQVQVPDTVSLPLVQAQQRLSQLGLQASVRGRATCPSGQTLDFESVFRSDPFPGAFVEPGSTVRLDLEAICSNPNDDDDDDDDDSTDEPTDLPQLDVDVTCPSSVETGTTGTWAASISNPGVDPNRVFFRWEPTFVGQDSGVGLTERSGLLNSEGDFTLTVTATLDGFEANSASCTVLVEGFGGITCSSNPRGNSIPVSPPQVQIYTAGVSFDDPNTVWSIVSGPHNPTPVGDSEGGWATFEVDVLESGSRYEVLFVHVPSGEFVSCPFTIP